MRLSYPPEGVIKRRDRARHLLLGQVGGLLLAH